MEANDKSTTVKCLLPDGGTEDAVLTPEMVAVFAASKRMRRNHIRADERHRDSRELIDGITEILAPDIRCQNTVADALDLLETRDAVRCALEQLNDSQRRRIEARFYGCLTNVEIAKIEGVSETAVRGSIKLALKRVKKFLENGFDFA